MPPFIYSRTSRPEIDIDLECSYSFRKRFVISILNSGYESVTRVPWRLREMECAYFVHRMNWRIDGIEGTVTSA